MWSFTVTSWWPQHFDTLIIVVVNVFNSSFFVLTLEKVVEMTSLAHQLKRLALPQSDPSLLSRRGVASVLFDPKDAASMDRSTIYALGMNTHSHIYNKMLCISHTHVTTLHLLLTLTYLLFCVYSVSEVCMFIVQVAQGLMSCLELSQHSSSFRKPSLARLP